jgi:predicted metalloprotease
LSNQQWGPPPGQQPQWQAPPGQQPPWQGPTPYAGPPPGQYYAPQGAPGQQGLGWGQLPPQPPKKRSTALAVLLVLGGLAVLGVVGLAVASKILKHNDEPIVTQPVGTATTEPLPTQTSAPPTAPATTRAPSAPVTTKPSPPRKPALTPSQIVTADRLYKTGLQRAVSCTESKVGLSTVSKATAYYRQIKKCLDRAWPRQVEAAGYRFRPPGLIAWVGAANSPCGNSDRSLSFYCSTNHTIYMDVSDDVGYWRQNKQFARALASHTVAHEYGHAVQYLTGILPAYYAVHYQVGPAKALELNRRMELQASCLGNVFLGTNRGSYGIKGQMYTQWLYIVNNSGDVSYLPRDHGSRKSHGYWSRRGFTSRKPAMCNTFVAPAAQVS